MSDVIFRTGTVLKRDVTTLICDEFINAGWQQVSTDTVGDGYIFYSTGEDGGKKIFIRMKANTDIYSFDGAEGGYRMDFWTLKDYIPNPGGSGPGTMTVGINTTYVIMGYGNLTFSTPAQYFIHTNKDRMVLFLEWPPSAGAGPHVVYLGAATTFYPEIHGQSNTILASSIYGGAAALNSIVLQNNNMNTLNSTQSMSWYYTTANTNPDREGKYYLSELYFGNNVEGYRGKINDVYLLPTANVVWKDEIFIETQTYRIMTWNCIGGNYTYSFPNNHCLAIRIA